MRTQWCFAQSRIFSGPVRAPELPGFGYWPAGRRFVTAMRAEVARPRERPGFRGPEELERRRVTAARGARLRPEEWEQRPGLPLAGPQDRGGRTREGGPGTTVAVVPRATRTRHRPRPTPPLSLFFPGLSLPSFSMSKSIHSSELRMEAWMTRFAELRLYRRLAGRPLP